MSPDFTPGDLDRLQAKPRPKGSIPYLPDTDDPEVLRDWLTLAFRPPPGWTIHSFERTGRDRRDPATLLVINGRESKPYRFDRQADLVGTSLRSAVLAIADGKLRMPHLTGGEIEDVWAALCMLGQVLTEWDERDEARKWCEQMIVATMPLRGHTLAPDGRHAALMALKSAGEFTRPDALSLVRPGNADEQRYQQRPARFVDETTGEQWLRAGEMATYLRWVLGVEPLSHKLLRSRLKEIGVVGRVFEDYRPPHPKLNLYQLTDELVEYTGEAVRIDPAQTAMPLPTGAS